MSSKEKNIEILDSIPDYKMSYVLAYVQGVAAGSENPVRLPDSTGVDNDHAKL